MILNTLTTIEILQKELNEKDRLIEEYRELLEVIKKESNEKSLRITELEKNGK